MLTISYPNVGPLPGWRRIDGGRRHADSGLPSVVGFLLANSQQHVGITEAAHRQTPMKKIVSINPTSCRRRPDVFFVHRSGRAIVGKTLAHIGGNSAAWAAKWHWKNVGPLLTCWLGMCQRFNTVVVQHLLVHATSLYRRVSVTLAVVLSNRADTELS